MSSSSASRRAAVLYDVDGALVDSRIVYAYIYFALRLPRLRERVGRVLRASALSPVYAFSDLMQRPFVARLFYANYKGLPIERLRLMGREVVERAILPNLYSEARKRIEKAREMGLVQVFVSSGLDFIVEPLAAELGVEHVIANRLEFQNGEATGKLLEPVLSGEEKKRAVLAFARERSLDLAQSYCFGDSRADLPLLEAAGFPCVVNPEPRLEEIASERGWPILQFT
jgi:HAD superfamily hydrolase (TIGR01490 family)